MRILGYSSNKVYSRKKLCEQLMQLTNEEPLDSPMKRFIESQKKGFIYVAWEEGRPIGWASLLPSGKKYVIDIFVAEQHRNQKIASKMICRMKDKKLVARPWDEAGRNLYKKFKNIST